MTTGIKDIVIDLTRKGVLFRVEGKDLLLDAPKGLVTEKILKSIKLVKPEIIRFVEPIDNLMPEDLTGIDLQFYLDLYEIMTSPKFGMPPKDAEQEAMNMVKGSIMIIRLKGATGYEGQSK